MPNIFMVDLAGPEILEEEKELINHPNVGALILFARNFTSSEQLRTLTAAIHKMRPDIFIAMDHEGGFAQRCLRFEFRALPAARVYGDFYNKNPEAALAMAKEYGAIMAQDLLAHGVDLSLAPVLDLHGISNVIGKLDRAFHSMPEIVTALAKSFIEGMHTAGMPQGVGKHFPGHGSCSLDSHIEKPIHAVSRDELFQKDIIPFANLIKEKKIAALMPAHITYPAVDENNAASFSKVWLQDILRTELGFDGLVISDCLSMKGADIGDLPKRSTLALEAGCELLILCNQGCKATLEVVNAVQFTPNSEAVRHLDAFKKQMVRFSDKKNDYQATSSMIFTKLEEGTASSMQQATPSDAGLNKTLSI